ncbi:hypothetical protein [Clostridium saudiense]|uniref:hypothetical protein n=1 Tax=Clostridium saudiense TaxID=1414720 RepID=UPI002906F41C|nr:hypothetical protein [Clostridium saudiense]MDU7455392.1 hypothetical protein [Clostridium saudiense]
MANFLGTLLYFLVLLAIVFGVMFLGRKYVFSKVRINKYIPLGIAIVLFILQIFMLAILGKNIVWVSFLLTILTVTFFLWFMDIVTTGGPKQKEKKIEIRPKAKPNRVKHLNNAQNNTNNKK